MHPPPARPSSSDSFLPSLPKSFPIKELDYLGSRSYFQSFHYPFNKASVPLPSYAVNLPSRPRILVCHDMAGGYKDDKWVQGANNPDAYAIWHWHMMDIFVYFSHDLVTIPPPCWTNAAHKHGVKVLGTFITELEEGRVPANELLSTKKSAQMYAERLAELAVALGFDGWLINMEVELNQLQIPNMKEFVSHLTQKMHSSVPGSLVIWYDSVTKDGNLRWQDQLNTENEPFFDLCDGIFINYTWKANYPKLSAVVAGERKFDVYMGIDVFGRNTFGGGHWNVIAALDILKKDNVSAAIFAPGWVYETKQPPNFQTAQNRWWSLIEKSWGILQCYPKELPFYSNFDQGHGYHFYVDGFKVSDRPWNNISCQHFQPALDYVDSSQKPIQVLVDLEGKCYSGGGKIKFFGNLNNNVMFRTRIFQGELDLGYLSIHISYSVSSEGKCLVGLCFWLVNTNGEKTSVLIASECSGNLPSEKFNEIIIPSEKVTGEGWTLHESDLEKCGYKLTQIEAVCYMKGEPHADEPKMLQGHDKLKENDSEISSQNFEASVGHISICASEQKTEFPPANSWYVECHDVSWSSNSGSKILSVKIHWTPKVEGNSSFKSYNIYVERLVKGTEIVKGDGKFFYGVANVESFYISKLMLPLDTAVIKFIIQVCGLDGACQKLDESPAIQLVVVD